MKQQKRKLCTVLLCVILTITNILSAGMPVYAQIASADNTTAVYDDKTTLFQTEDQTEDTTDTSVEQGKEEQEKQDNTVDDLENDDNTESGGGSGSSEGDDVENSDNSESGKDSELDDDANTNQDTDDGEDANVDDEFDAGVDTDTDTEDANTEDVDIDEGVGLEETAEDNVQPSASWDYPTEDPREYDFSDVTMTPGSYSAEFSATSREYVSSSYLRVVYTEDEEAAEDFFSGVSNISGSELYGTAFKEATLQNLDYEYRYDYDDNGYYSSFYDWTGTFLGESVLTPNKTYYYRLVYYEYSYQTYSNTYYFLTEPAQFTTGDPVEKSRVTISDIEVEETGYTNVKVVWTVDNPDQEALFDMRLYYMADGEENASYSYRSAYPYRDDNNEIVSGKYYATLSGITGNYIAYAQVTVYTGNGLKTPVSSEEIEVTPKDFEESRIVLTPKEGTSSFTASITLSPYYTVDSSIQTRLYYRIEGTENWLSSPSGYLYSTDGGSAAVGTVTVSGLPENTTYEYYITLAGRNVESLGSVEKPLTFTTKEIVAYEDDVFPDPVFRSYIKQQIGISDSYKITSDKLERLTSISCSRNSALGDIKSLEGIEYIENLTSINFEGHTITNPGKLDRLTNLSSINLNYNDLTELPDMSELPVLRYAYFNYNKLDPVTITADKLPAAFLISNSYWIDNTRQSQRGEVTSQLAPEYYASGEARPFLIKVTGLKGDYNRSYTLTLTVNDKSVSYENLQYEYYNVYYIADILKDSSGADTGIILTDGTSCSADITLTDNYGNTYVDLKGQKLTFVTGESNLVANTSYIRPDAKNAYINIDNLPASFTQSDIRSIELKNEKGERVGDADPSGASIYSSYYNPYEDVFGYFYLSDMAEQQGMQLGVTVYFAKYLDPGDYTAVITMTDGTVLSAEKAVHVEKNMAVLTNLYLSTEYDNYGDYLYLYASGANIDPTKVWPVLYEGDEPLTEKVSVTIGYDHSSAVYKLIKLKKDNKTYWDTYADKTYNYRFETDEKYSIQDKITDKTITLYALYNSHDFVVFEHYNYKKGVYEVKVDSAIANGTKVSVSVYSDYNHKNLKGTAESEIKDSMLLLEFKNESGETYAPPQSTNAYFIYSFVDKAGKTQTFDHQRYVQWYNYSSSSPGSSVYVTSNMMLYQERMLKSLDIDISFGPASVSNNQEVTAQIYDYSGRAVGGSKTLKGSTGSNGYVRFTGTWQDDTGLDSGVYTIRYRLAGSSSVLYTQTLYVYDNDTFYMSNQYMGKSTSGNTGSIYVYFGSEQLYGNYVNLHHSNVDDKKALEIWKNGGYDLEIFDRIGNKIEDWSIDHVTWSGRYFYLYLKNLSEDYTGYYVKITKNDNNGILLDTRGVYYATASNGNEQYGVWHTLYSGFSYYTGNYAYTGFSTSDIGKMYPVTVTIRRPYDTDVIKRFAVDSPNSGNVYYFTPSDLSETKTDEVYGLVLEGKDGTVSTTTCYLATRNQSTVVDATGVSLNKSSLSMQLGDEEKLTATVKPDNAANKNVTWSSSKNEVATVDADGTVTAVGTGTTTITATTHNGKTATCTVNVYNYTLNKTTMLFDLSSETVSPIQLTVNNGINDITSSVTWGSTDESVVTVLRGIVTPKGAGTAKILAAIKNGPTLTCDVTVSRDKLESITLSNSECTLNVGDTKQMKVYYAPSDVTVSDIVWESNNPEIAKVEADEDDPAAALVTALAAGTAKITVTVKSRSDETEIPNKETECVVTVCKVITADDILEIPTNLTALTNLQTKLADVELPEGWKWQYDEVSLKQFAGMQQKSFAAQYIGNEEGTEENVKPYETSLLVTLSTVTGISIDADSSFIRTGGEETLSIDWNMNGAPLDMSEYAGITFAWKSDKPDVVSIVESETAATTLTAVKTGSATITAQATFPDKTTFKAKYKVTVTNDSVADIQVEEIDNFTEEQSIPDVNAVEVSTYNYNYTDKDNNDDKSLPGRGTIYVKMTGANKLTVKSSNAKVISVGNVTAAEGEGEYTIPVTVNAAGTAQIILTANDAVKTHKDILLCVTDPKPNISEDTITVNLKQTTGTAFYLYPNDGYEVTEAKLAGENAKYFDLTHDKESDSYVIKTADTTLKKGSYKLTLDGKVKSQQGDEQDYDGVVFTVKVVEQAPKYKVKQSEKVNLFYKNAESILNITSDETLESAELNGCDFILDNRDGTYCLIPRPNIVGLAAKNCNKNGTLILHFAGYEDVEADFTVSVENKEPKITLESSSVTMYPSVGLNSTIINTGFYGDGTSVTFINGTATDAEFRLTEKDGKQVLEGSNLTQKEKIRAKLIFSNDNLWTKEVEVDYTINVNMGTPAAKLQKSTLQLNASGAFMAYDAASTEVMWKDGAEFNPLGVSVSATDTKSQKIINSGVVFGFDRTANKVIAKLNNMEVAKGSYKFKVNVRVTDTITVTTPLTVKIVNVDKAIKVSSKGSIDVLNRESTYVTVTPALKSLNGTIVDVSLSGSAAHLFDAEYEDTKVIIHAKKDVALITKYNYNVQLDLTIENAEGDTIRYTTSGVNLKLKQGKPKVSIAPKTATYFSGAYNNSMTRTISATIKGAENPVIKDVELMNNKDAFVCNYENGNIILTNKQGTVKGKTYSLQFKVTFDGQADNEKATTVKYSVKIR